MGLAHDAVTAVGRALSSVHAGEQKLLSRKLVRGDVATLLVTSPDFVDGGRLPTWATIDGEGRAPTLHWSGTPANARSIVVVCEDPDAPFPRPFVHYLVYGIPPLAHELCGKVEPPARAGENSSLKEGFTPPAPPAGHGLHHYHFQIFALDCPIDLPPDAGRGAVTEAMQSHVVGFGRIVGTYERT